jgi:hypothetical protein
MNRKADIERELAAMQQMSPAELRAKYAELFGEASRSGNRTWLLRRCAWRLQALAEGGLSDRARQRAQELARDQDLRTTVPSGMVMAPLDRPPDVEQPARKYATGPHDPRLPMPGGQLTRVYKGHRYTVEVLEDGFGYEGRRYQSLSAVAHAITGGHWNGYRFFNIHEPSKDSE